MRADDQKDRRMAKRGQLDYQEGEPETYRLHNGESRRGVVAPIDGTLTPVKDGAAEQQDTEHRQRRRELRRNRRGVPLRSVHAVGMPPTSSESALDTRGVPSAATRCVCWRHTSRMDAS